MVAWLVAELADLSVVLSVAYLVGLMVDLLVDLSVVGLVDLLDMWWVWQRVA